MTKVYERCAACSGEFSGRVVGLNGRDELATCGRCGGYHIVGSRAIVESLIRLDQPMSVSDFEDGARYFDATIVEDDGTARRVHGWIDRVHRVLQFG